MLKLLQYCNYIIIVMQIKLMLSLLVLYNWKGWRVGPWGGASPYKTLLSSLPHLLRVGALLTVSGEMGDKSFKTRTQSNYVFDSHNEKEIDHESGFGPHRRQEDKK